MRVLSEGICRANGKIYEKLTASELAPGSTIAPLAGSADAPHLPCQLFELPGNAGASERALVAVTPIVGLPSASYTLGELSPEGQVLSTVERTVDFNAAKWQSRKNYRLNKGLCAQIRCYDETHESISPLRLEVKRIIPCPTHIIVRGSVLVPNRGNHKISVSCLDANLSPIGEKTVCMGQAVVPLPNSFGAKDFQYQFSIHLPWNQDVIYFQAFDENHADLAGTCALHRDKIDELVKQSDWLFMHAGADPFYPEWFSSHKATAYELEVQRATSFPTRPLFSVIVPLYKTPELFFHEMLDSVTSQTYGNWQLVLVNASPELPGLASLVEQACASDARITSVTLAENGGISLNTNAGIEVATGDFVCFFDHDDLLEPNLLFEYAKAINEHEDIDLLYCDEDKLNPEGVLCAPYFKPDFNLDLLRDNNYVCHLLTIRKSLLDTLAPNTPEFDGAQDHNMTLQAVEHARRVHHVAKVLYHWRISETSTAANADSKPYANVAGIKAVSAHLKRLGIRAEVSQARFNFMYAVNYLPPENSPLVSVIIPTSDHVDVLKTCVDSILEKTTYDNYELVLVENNSHEPATFAYYEEVEREHPERVRVVTWPGEFNFSKIVNFGAREAKGDYLLLLNNDTEVITPEWMSRMLGICAREEVGAVGVRLYYPDDTIQHAGIVVTNKDAGHFCQDMPHSENWGYFNLADCQRDVSAVTAACMMARRDSFEAVGGFEEELSVAFNDVDFCLKLREKGYLVVYTPEVELYHYESLSRGFDLSEEQNLRNHQERGYLYRRWARHYAKSDPYYTPNLRETIELARYYHF